MNTVKLINTTKRYIEESKKRVSDAENIYFDPFGFNNWKLDDYNKNGYSSSDKYLSENMPDIIEIRNEMEFYQKKIVFIRQKYKKKTKTIKHYCNRQLNIITGKQNAVQQILNTEKERLTNILLYKNSILEITNMPENHVKLILSYAFE